MARILPEDGSFEAFDGFFLARSSKPIESVNSLYQPAFCFIVQGSKRVLLGRAIRRLREHYNEPLKIEETARGLRRPFVLRPRLQKTFRRSAATRHRKAAQQP
jgi:hypothetical protein